MYDNIFKNYGWTLEEWIIDNDDFYNADGINNKLVCEREFYEFFLTQTDYVAAKLIEAQVLGVECQDYTDILMARDFSRKRINEIQEEIEYNNSLT